MDRLTIKFPKGYLLQEPKTEEGAVAYINAIAEKLGAYEDAEEQGLLIKLPCKVGDTVYEISLVDQYRNPLIREMGVVDILLRDDDMYFTLRDLCDKDYDNSILITEFGRTVFLKKEEAEAKLKELRCDND